MKTPPPLCLSFLATSGLASGSPICVSLCLGLVKNDSFIRMKDYASHTMLFSSAQPCLSYTWLQSASLTHSALLQYTRLSHTRFQHNSVSHTRFQHTPVSHTLGSSPIHPSLTHLVQAHPVSPTLGSSNPVRSVVPPGPVCVPLSLARLPLSTTCTPPYLPS